MITKAVTVLVAVTMLGLLGAVVVNHKNEHFPIQPPPSSGKVQLESASTPEAWKRGLAGHAEPDDLHGLLLDFKDSASKRCIWNKGVPYSVDAGFYDENWRLLGGVTMTPNSDQQICSTVPVRYVIEMRGGWFKTHVKG